MNSVIRRALLKCIATALLLVPDSYLVAQANTANFAGIVEDSTNSRIPDAHVQLINVVNGSESDATTNANGVFLLPGVFPGTYILRIERDGFATAQVSGLVLRGSDTRNLLIQLKVGPVTDTVQIDLSTISLNTTDATVGATLDRKFVTSLPLNGRSFEDLITTTPGVLTQTPQALGGLGPGGVSVNGQRADANYVLVDGVSGNFGPATLLDSRKPPSAGNLIGLTAIGTTQSLASVDALQEFRVLSSSYAAEYGSAPGGQFSFLTRSAVAPYRGAIHDSVYNYRRYNLSDSIDWFDGLIGQNRQIFANGYFAGFINYHQNDFGGTLESPLVIPGILVNSEKTFVFLSYEQLHAQQPTAFQEQFVPNDSSGCNPWPSCSDIPMALWPVFQDFPTSYFPNPNSPAILGPIASYFSMPSSLRSTGVRLDHRFTSNTSFFFRYNKLAQ